jgi:hypothetical protein
VDVLGWVLLGIVAILVLALLVMVGMSVPDIARYLRIKRL